MLYVGANSEWRLIWSKQLSLLRFLINRDNEGQWNCQNILGLAQMIEVCILVYSGCSTDMITGFCPHLHFCCLSMVDPGDFCGNLFFVNASSQAV